MIASSVRGAAKSGRFRTQPVIMAGWGGSAPVEVHA
jgi:hypothetical protein